MKFIVIGSDTEKAESWMLHGIYMNRNDAENGALRNARSEVNPERYHYSVVEIAEKEMELFRSLPANPAIQAKTLVADVSLVLKTLPGPNPHIEVVDFTNVPMERVHAAIGVLNRDTPIYADTDSLSTVAERNAKFLAENRDVEITRTRTEDFTLLELFPAALDGFTGDHCQECGGIVAGRNQRRHVTWHNKLLP